MGRKIVQRDLDGNLLRERDDFDDIYFELGFRASYIRKCIKGVLTKAYGYKWEYKYD